MKSYFERKKPVLYYFKFAHFGPMVEFVMNGLIWEASVSSFAEFCLFLPKGQHFILSLHLKL